MINDVLEMFSCLVVNEDRIGGKPCLTHANLGVITDFVPTPEQAEALTGHFNPLDITTLFTREERETASLDHLLTKQLLHYIEVYGFGAPGLFDLEVTTGQIVVMRFVQGITRNALEVLVQNLLYANAPIKDAAQLKRIIDHYDLTFDINRVANNELRVLLYRPGLDTFVSGDDAVRYLCWLATGEALLIKSPEVIAAIRVFHATSPSDFFERHALPLAQVFNRHKRLILAAKGKRTATAINRIARLSKTQHVPIKESIAKTFVSGALADVTDRPMDVLAKISVRDKFKYLNLLERKLLQSEVDSFNIRNGKIHISNNRPVYTLPDITRVERAVLNSLTDDLSFLRGQTILLDANVDYGLPISRKQTVGNLPFGTRVTSPGDEISSGMYWENAWGARDLDLSTIDKDGNRVGWGGYGGYTDQSILFSGDLTDASTGAMEFMTSKGKDYGLFVNVYSGEKGAEMELVVGARTKKQWISAPVIRERVKLKSRECVIGFVKDGTYIAYMGRLNNKRMSASESPIVNDMRVNRWTLQQLFITLGVKFAIDRDPEVEYDHDLSYSSFSFDKLEAVFKNEIA